MDEFQKQMLAFMSEAKEKQKIDEERRQVEEARRLEEQNMVAKRLDDVVDEIAQKVQAGIKKEVKEAVEPLKDRQDKAEKETEAANAKIDKLAEEISEMRKEMARKDEKSRETWASRLTNSVGTSEGNPPEGWHAKSQTPQRSEKERHCSGGMEEKAGMLIKNAKRVIGFKPIDKIHVKQCMRRVKEKDENLTEEEAWVMAKKEAVTEFLKYEMKMKEDDIEQVKSVMIYPPAKEEWNVLYVEYENDDMVNFIRSFAQYMRKGEKESRPSIEKYIPKELFKRYSAIEKMAFEIRKNSNFKTATNISFGENDLVLRTRPKEIQPGGRRAPWHQLEAVPLPEDIPQFKMNLVRRVLKSPRSPGEAPGRPPHTPEQGEKRKIRASPITNSPSSPSSKVSRPSHPAGRNTSDTPTLSLSNRFQCLNKSNF